MNINSYKKGKKLQSNTFLDSVRLSVLVQSAKFESAADARFRNVEYSSL